MALHLGAVVRLQDLGRSNGSKKVVESPRDGLIRLVRQREVVVPFDAMVLCMEWYSSTWSSE